ncbi:MAG TPA: hypothetical protein VLD36_21545 [Burkholderiales bacterium]|jgi:hypothetical protein|nr:hypothetical protein [Burkholderiales bacterium]
MKRNLIAFAAAALALGTTAAFADNNFTFDDPYWKQAESTQTVHSASSIKMERNYDLVDNYIP